MFVFVYGTLKRGYGNNYLLNDAYFVSKAVTTQKWRMFDAGFPVLRDRDRDQPHLNAFATGEVYHFKDVAILQRLDRLEGEGRMYHRTLINVQLEEYNAKIKVFAYLGDKNFWAHKTKQHLLPLQNDRYVWPPRDRAQLYATR